MHLYSTGEKNYLIKSFEKFVHIFTLRTAQMAQLALVIVMAITVTNVFIRIPWKPMGGAVEMVEIAGAVLLALGVAYTAYMKGHIAVGVLIDRLSPRGQAVADILVHTISLLFSFLLAREMFLFAFERMQAGYVTGYLRIPIAPSIYLVAFGFLMLALVLLLELFKAINLLIKGSGSE